MHMTKLTVGVALGVLIVAAAGCSEKAAAPAQTATPAATEAPKPAPTGDEAKIQSAMSAAPEAVAKDAMVMDMNADGSMKELRAGTNGFTCLPDNPATPGPDPMCTDANGMMWMDAMLKKQPPPAGKAALMHLASGTDASNTDTHAAAPTADNRWIKTGPHVMIMGATGWPAIDRADRTRQAIRDVGWHALCTS
jgi:hypothetical protein